MKYNIISINDDRIDYKTTLRSHVDIEEVFIPSIVGSLVDIENEFKARGLKSTSWTPKIGEAGVWLSHFDCWQWAADNEDLIVFEDDAVVDDEFNYSLDIILNELPMDYDFCSLWVPDNQRQDYYYVVSYDDEGQVQISGSINKAEDSHFYTGSKYLARAYQGYGLVATLYSRKGADRLIEMARHRGVCTPVDCFIFQESHTERVKGYAPRPQYEVVHYDWTALTTVHNTGDYNAI